MYSWQFSKKISSPQKWLPFWIFEFLPKMEKHKFGSISLTVRDRVSLSKFSITGYLRNVLLAIFKKFSSPQIWRPFWIFAKNGKHTFASISLTVWDRVISSKLSTHRVSKQCTLGNFQKNFLCSKMAAILNFCIFAKNTKTQICFYLLNCVR